MIHQQLCVDQSTRNECVIVAITCLGGTYTEKSQTLPYRLRKIFKTLYPWANTGFELWLMAWNIAYLFDKTAFYRPWLSWIGVDLRRIGAADLVSWYKPRTLPILNLCSEQRVRIAEEVKSQNLNKGILATLRRWLIFSPNLLLDSLKVLLPTCIFFIKFLEWWYSPSSPARSLSGPPSGPAIPPPRLLRPHPQGLSVDGVKYGECPICRSAIVNATALPSGYVFCYRCAHAHVERHRNCPVTLLPAQIWQLRKVLA